MNEMYICHAGSDDHVVNCQIVFIIMLHVAMCIFCAIAFYIWHNYLAILPAGHVCKCV